MRLSVMRGIVAARGVAAPMTIAKAMVMDQDNIARAPILLRDVD